MKNENTNALKKMLEEQKQTPTYGDSFKLMLLTSIATSLACIADAIMKDEEVEPIYCDTDSSDKEPGDAYIKFSVEGEAENESN